MTAKILRLFKLTIGPESVVDFKTVGKANLEASLAKEKGTHSNVCLP